MFQSSQVWKFYRNIKDKTAVCKSCGQTIKTSGNTTNAKAHLSTHHMDEENVQKLFEAEPPELKKRKSEEQTTLFSLGFKKEEKVCDRDFLYMICKDLEALNIVEHIGFNYLVKKLNPNVTVPSRYTVTKLLDIVSKEEKEKLQIVLNSVKHLAITVDFWSSRATVSYGTVTVHYLDDDFQVQNKVIAVRPLREDHTIDNIRNWILEILLEYNIKEKVRAVVSDNASNMNGAVKNIAKHLGCSAHKLNLCVQASLGPMEPLLKKVRVIVSYFHRSASAARDLAEKQFEYEESGKLMIDVQHRWNSTLYMGRSVLNNFKSIEKVLWHREKKDMILSKKEIQELTQLQELLEPFDIATIE